MSRTRSTTARILKSTLRKVPNSNHVSELVCKHFCGTLLVDGKYIHVKGYARKIPLLWAVDYYSHDIIAFVLATSESYETYQALFAKVKACGYNLSTIVCDELDSIPLAASFYYPKLKVQFCINHVKENIRRRLNSRTNLKHIHFIKQMEHLFRQQSVYQYSKYARKLFEEHRHHRVYRRILLELNLKHEYLIRHLLNQAIPGTNDLLELVNLHLEARLKGMKWGEF